MSDIKIIALGGVRENAKNLYIVEINDSIFILDAGLRYPENEQLGVDFVIPNLDYLVENKDRIQGIFLTHGHADAIGALPYILQDAKVPVFGSSLTIELAKLFVKNAGVNKFNNFHVIDSETEIEFDDAVVSFFKTTHSIPESMGIVLGTDRGNIVYTGDFKFDQAARPYYKTDLGRLAEIGQEGVLALLSDSANATSTEQTASEAEVGQEIDQVIADADGRVIIAAVASNLVRIQQVFDSAAEHGRRVVLTGFDVENIVRTAIRLKKLTVEHEKLIVKPKDMNKFEDHELIILENGRMGEPIDGLQKMAVGRHRYVQIKDGDLVYIVTTPSIAKEAAVARVNNAIYKAGGAVKMITQNLRVSGHANARELQLMMNLLRPQYLFPVQGEYRELQAHAELALEVGLLPENIYIVKRGDIMHLSEDQGFLHEGTVPAGDVMIDGNAIGDVGNIVLRDRQHLAEDGILIVVLTLEKRTNQLLAGPDIVSRGFVYVRESEGLMEEARQVLSEALEACLTQNRNADWSKIKLVIRDTMNEFIWKRTKRRPMILPIIMDV